MGKVAKMRRRIKKLKRVLTVDDFIEAQLSRYIKIHKQHEKEISYIG